MFTKGRETKQNIFSKHFNSNPRLLYVFNDYQWGPSPAVPFGPNQIHFSRRTFFKFPLVICTRVVGAGKPRQFKVHPTFTSKAAIRIMCVAELGLLELYMLQLASLVRKTAGIHIDAIRDLFNNVTENTGEWRCPWGKAIGPLVMINNELSAARIQFLWVLSFQLPWESEAPPANNKG